MSSCTGVYCFSYLHNAGHSLSDAYFIEGAIRNDPGYLFLVWSPVYLENEADRGFLEYNLSVECTGGMKTFTITNTTTHTFNDLPDDIECHFTIMSNMDGCSSGSSSGLVDVLRLRTNKLGKITVIGLMSSII